MKKRFFEFNQNNSGGSWDHQPDAGIGYCVIIEADSTDDADRKAESIGLYFNGCDDDRDCPCCGDRWYAQWRGDKGDEAPSHYGKPIDFTATKQQWGIPSYVHYANGTIRPCNL